MINMSQKVSLLICIIIVIVLVSALIYSHTQTGDDNRDSYDSLISDDFINGDKSHGDGDSDNGEGSDDDTNKERCSRAFEYNIRENWDYALDQRDGQVFTVHLTSDGFTIPKNAPIDNATALLELEIAAHTLPSRPCDEPSIEFSANNRTLSQHFAQGATGRRYLNISGVLGTEKHISMSSNTVDWHSGPARLIVFQNPHINQSTRTLVIAPHPDDAEIGAFGLYATTDSDVVTVIAGDSHQKRYGRLFENEDEHRRVKGRLRFLDSLTVPFIGGVPFNRTRNLGYSDLTLHMLYEQRNEITPPRIINQNDGYFRRLNNDPQLKNRPFKHQWNQLVNDMLLEVARTMPDIIVTTNPLLDLHSDHQYTTIALIEALEKYDNWDGLLLLYTNHPTDNRGNYISYPLGPSTAVEPLTPWFGDKIPFKSVLSYPVDEHTRRLNILALEAMHDLRPFCHHPDGSYEEGCFGQLGYMHRGPRPNKLYLVLTLREALQLKEIFLQQQ